MASASTIRMQIESALARKIPSALTPQPKMGRPVVETGIEPLDDLLQGGLPVGAVSELTGPECSGRTSVALSFLARITEANKVCAWIDVTNSFDPASAAAMGINLKKLLWVRCGVQQTITARAGRRFLLPEKYFAPRPIKKGLHGGGFGPHPRTEVRGLSDAVGDLFAPRCAEPQHRPRPYKGSAEPSTTAVTQAARSPKRAKQYDAIEQGVRSADLLLQTGGFSAIVLDLGSIAPEYVARIELSTWHRYRLAAERTQSSILLLSQYPCAKSSSELELRLSSVEEVDGAPTVFTGMQSRVEVVRHRFAQTESNVVPLRKPPQKAHMADWRIRTTWAVRR
ncbi:recombinase RecA [Edaphobacter sp. HDX4]|uniref:ATPase domain-containing protein n=1 Tax=Edaphobacter sp. HDX4 TaxID=2794064 RepID=UPI002FE50D5B